MVKYRKLANKYTLSYLRGVHMSRSPASILSDNKIDAKKQFSHKNKKGVDAWMKYPHQYDIIGVDNVSASYPRINTFKKQHQKKTRVKRAPLKKSRHGKSKSRRSRERLKFSDPYERQMVSRLRKKTGMSHIQVSNLVRQAQKSDYIDAETMIGSVQGLSKNRSELYDFAKRKIGKELDKRKTASDYTSHEISEMESKYAAQAAAYYG